MKIEAGPRKSLITWAGSKGISPGFGKISVWSASIWGTPIRPIIRLKNGWTNLAKSLWLPMAIQRSFLRPDLTIAITADELAVKGSHLRCG